MSKLQELVIKYPEAFKNPEKNYGFDHFGFECGEGWAELLDPVCAYIEEHNKTAVDDERIAISQIKEKFAGLRFYTNFGTDELYRLINIAEDQSFHTCEKCGKPGKITGTHWISTRCEEHEN